MELWDGYLWRKNRREEELAYFTCHLMNVAGKVLKKDITPAMLLKPLRQPQKKQKSKTSRIDDEQYLREKFKLGGET